MLARPFVVIPRASCDSADAMQVLDGPDDKGTAMNPLTEQSGIEEPAAENEAFTDAFEDEDDDEGFRHRRLLVL